MCDFPVKELQALLKKAKETDSECEQFGADCHRYEWNPPASLKEVEAFEKKIGVELPEQYRQFLLKVADGGAGPHCGLFSIEEVESWLDWSVEADKTPYLTPEIAEQGDFSRQDMTQDDWKRGCIPISSQGDIYFTYLMVTGPNRGRVVYVEYEMSWAFFPKEKDFLSWYMRWLREVGNNYDTSGFAMNLDGDEKSLQQHYLQATSKEEKCFALESMLKIRDLPEDSQKFMKKAVLEQIDMLDIRDFLELFYTIDVDFVHELLQKRWELGLYVPVVQELYSLFLHTDIDKQQMAEKWYAPIMEVADTFSVQEKWLVITVLFQSKQLSLKRVLPWFQDATTSREKIEFVILFTRFPDAKEHIEFWSALLEEREDLELLAITLKYLVRFPCQEFKEQVLKIQEEFAFAQEKIFCTDVHDAEQLKKSVRRRKENEVYEAACAMSKEFFYNEINPIIPNVPRPYRIEMYDLDMQEFDVDRPSKKGGAPIHVLVAWSICTQFGRCPSKAKDWEKTFEKVKKLTIELNEKTVINWNRTRRKVVLCPPDKYLPRKHYYYSLQDWSILGEMENLKNLSIRGICVEDFSFLPKCTSVNHLSLENTNFSDCRLLLQMPNLKSVDLRMCPLKNKEVLETVSFTYQI